jgi:hypothetical protein
MMVVVVEAVVVTVTAGDFERRIGFLATSTNTEPTAAARPSEAL